MLSFTIGQSSISVFLDGEFNSIDNTHANYTPLLEELKRPATERNLDAIRTYITIKKMIEVAAAGFVEVFEDEIRYGGETVDNYMTQRMIELIQQGFDITPWARFMDNVFKNPAQYARDELYEWMEKADMPITPDGCFLAFKKVRDNYKDCHTGMFDNSPGTILEMDREACDPIRDNHCSSGFHFCSVGYLSQFGGQRIVVVKINPEHVTSIPNDYGFTKGRTCRYEVIAELTKQSAAHHKCWKTGIVDLENPQELPAEVIASIKFPVQTSEPTPVVIADSDPEEETLSIAYEPGERIYIIRDSYQAGKIATVSYTDDDGFVWAHVDGVMGNVPKSGFGLKHKFDPANIRPLSPAEQIEDEMSDAGKAAPKISTRDEWMQRDIDGSKAALERGDITAAMRSDYLEKCQKRYDVIFDETGELRRPNGGLEYTPALLPPYDAVVQEVEACIRSDVYCGKPVSELTDDDIALIAGAGLYSEDMKADLRAQRSKAHMEKRDREFDAMVESGNFTWPKAMTLSEQAERFEAQFEAMQEAAHENDTTDNMLFTTSDGRVFSGGVIRAALEDASIRGAARNLGVQDSTLRGWKKKMGL